MKKEDYDKPDEHIFYCDKTDWYELKKDKDGKEVQDWTKSESQREEFWTKLRQEKMAKNDLDFSDFVFPWFNWSEPTFWEEGEKKEFKYQVTFTRTNFSGKANFSKASFSRDVYFDRTTFSSEAYFIKATFLNEAYFINVNFLSRTSFAHTSFLNKADFRFSIFSNRADFYSISFSSLADFDYATFLDEANFNGTKFLGEEAKVSFERTQFSKRVEFRKTVFKKAAFIETVFNAACLFQAWTIEEAVTFDRVLFNPQVQFESCDMEKVVFSHCNLFKADFSNSRFKQNKGRIVLLNDPEERDLEDLSNTYRQFKRNFMDSKDWTKAGDAYRSEMVIKQKLAKQQKKRLTQGIMWFYDCLSGYQQNMGRPLKLFFVLILIVSLLLLCIFDSSCAAPLNKVFIAFKTSLDAALPVVGKIEVNTEHYPNGVYFLLLFERIFSIILITFFGLATRARLRQ